MASSAGVPSGPPVRLTSRTARLSMMLRADGRRPLEIRSVSATLGLLGSNTDGSAQLTIGSTLVLAAVTGPVDTDKRTQHAYINVHVQHNNMGTKRERELEAAIRNALEQTVMLESYPRSMISVSISVLQNDGAVLPACINAASLALVNAGIPMKELLVACSAGYINATPLVDLTWNEAANAPEIILAVLAESQGIILLDMKSKLPLPYIEQLTILANQGCLAIAHVLKETIKNYAIVNTNSWNLC